MWIINNYYICEWSYGITCGNERSWEVEIGGIFRSWNVGCATWKGLSIRRRRHGQTWSNYWTKPIRIQQRTEAQKMLRMLGVLIQQGSWVAWMVEAHAGQMAAAKHGNSNLFGCFDLCNEAQQHEGELKLPGRPDPRVPFDFWRGQSSFSICRPSVVVTM